MKRRYQGWDVELFWQHVGVRFGTVGVAVIGDERLETETLPWGQTDTAIERAKELVEKHFERTRRAPFTPGAEGWSE